MSEVHFYYGQISKPRYIIRLPSLNEVIITLLALSCTKAKCHAAGSGSVRNVPGLGSGLGTFSLGTKHLVTKVTGYDMSGKRVTDSE